MASTHGSVRAVRAKVRPRTDLGVQAAGVGAVGVDRAAARALVQELTIAVGAAAHRELLGFGGVALHHLGFVQAQADGLGVEVLRFKSVHQPQAHEVAELDLEWHGAAVGLAGVTQPFFVTGPGVDSVDIDHADGAAHGASFGRFQCAPVAPGRVL
jgi:hypothetical protein